MDAPQLTKEQERLLAAQESTADSIESWTNLLVLVSAGLLLLAFAPDSLVVSDNAQTEMPFIGSASIKLVLFSGPLVLLLMRLFLSSYLYHWNKLEGQVARFKPSQEFRLSVMQNRRLRRWAGFVHFPLVIIVFVTTTWKGLAFPLWGEFMGLVTIAVTIWLTYRAARTGRWFNLAMLLLIIVTSSITVYYELMEPVGSQTNRHGPSSSRRTWDAEGSRLRAIEDQDEDSYRGSLFWVNCSSPAVVTIKREANGCIARNENGTKTTDLSERATGDLTKTANNGAAGGKKGGKLEKRSARDRMRRLLASLNRFFLIQRQLDLSGADIERADLRYLNLQWASMTHANLAHALFRYAKLQNATFTAANLEEADFGYAEMGSADLKRAILNKARFWRAKMQRANLSGAKLESASLVGARLDGAKLRHAKLKDAKLRHANLTGADLRRAALPCADLSGATLDSADFSRADLREALFEKTPGKYSPAPRFSHMQGTKLTCTDLRGTDLTEMRGLTQEQIDSACTDASTRVPEGLISPAHCPSECGIDRNAKPPKCSVPE